MSRLYVRVTSDTGRGMVTQRGRRDMLALFGHEDINGREPMLKVSGDERGYVVYVKDQLGRWLLVHSSQAT